VRKSIAWALKEIGKRNKSLKKIALDTAKELDKLEAKSAHWIATDAIKELSAAPKSSKSAAPKAAKRASAKVSA
jgi:3-methyladenine DNA glycosylase AlkD